MAEADLGQRHSMELLLVIFIFLFIALQSSLALAPVVVDPSSSTSSGLPAASDPSLPLSLHNFVLFGKIHFHKEDQKQMGCKLEVSVEIGEHVWLEHLKTRFYVFQVPTSIYTGMVGTLSVVAGGKTFKKNLWNHSFVVQDDIGAHHLDADIGAAIASMDCLEEENMAGKGRANAASSTISSEILVNQKGPLALMYPRVTQLLVCLPPQGQEKICPIISGTDSVRPRLEMGHIYGFQAVGPIRLEAWKTVCLILLFASINSIIGLLKNIDWIEAAIQSKDADAVKKHPKPAYTDAAFWHQQSNGPEHGRSLREYFSYLKSKDELPCPSEEYFREAWHDVNCHLTRVGGSSSFQGNYFYYNYRYGIHAEDKQDSALGKWNRDGAGRLTREIWPVDDMLSLST